MRIKIVFGFILVLVSCRVSLAQGIHLAVDDSYEPHTSVDYPFVFPLTGTMSRGDWVMSCATSESCSDNGVKICDVGETNFGVDYHLGCPMHHTGEDWVVRSQANSPSTFLAANRAVRSINHGVVVYAGLHQSYNGYVVIVKHRAMPSRPFVLPAYAHAHGGSSCGRVESQSLTVYSYYLHLDDLLAVRAGEQVLKSQVLGYTYSVSDVSNEYLCAGVRGGGGPRAYCPHLHFEIWSQIYVDDEYDFDPNGYDVAGCQEGQFGHRLGKLVEPKAFLEANNSGPVIMRVAKSASGNVIIHGVRLGGAPGTVVVSGGLGPRSFTPSDADWNDDSIILRGELDATRTLDFQVRRMDGVSSNIKKFPFIDVDVDDWFSPALMDGWSVGIFAGRDHDVCSESSSGGCSFAPSQIVRRSDLVVAVIRAIEVRAVIGEAGAVPGGVGAAPPWLYPYLEKAYGYRNPNNGNEPVGIWQNDQIATGFWAQPVTRQEAAHVVMNGRRLAPGSAGDRPFSDVDPAVAGWVYSCRAAGIISGDGDRNSFRPNDPLNRAELARIIDMAFLDGEE